MTEGEVIKQLKAELEAANHDYAELMKERTDYVAENERLKKALKKYGRHYQCDCRAVLVERKGKGKGWYPADCNCGFDQALQGKQNIGDK